MYTLRTHFFHECFFFLPRFLAHLSRFLRGSQASHSQHLVSEPWLNIVGVLKMAKKAGDCGMEMVVSAATPLMLSKTNYRVWAMRMEVLLESHDLWSVMVDNDVPKKKERMTLSVILSVVPEDVMVMLDAKKTAKENWEILRQRNLGVDRVIQSRIQDFGRGGRRARSCAAVLEGDSFKIRCTHLVLGAVWRPE
ncbi:uncharacterized protein LOC144707688 [Wolffia australiana]